MKTTATNRKVRELITALREKKLIPRPDFQRRLVWSNKDKSAFIETVLLNYPFPEIYVAAGDVNVETGEGTELLVDGQQRLTTLFQYFTGSPDLVLTHGISRYDDLPREQKEAFLQYDVAVRDVGYVDIETIRNVFLRMNSTRYALNAMEIHNARYEGEFKTFCEDFAQRPFFELHRIFSSSEIRRMQDVRFIGALAATILSTYFNRDDEVEEFLSRYNDEFPMKEELARELDHTLEFVDALSFPDKSRAWKKADFFSLIVELHRTIFKKGLKINAKSLEENLSEFYKAVDDPASRADANCDAAKYYKAALQATNDRSSRLARGEIISKIISQVIQLPT